MKTFMLLTAVGPLVVLTSHSAITEPGPLRELNARGITKFVAYEIPLALAKERYGSHFFVVEHDLDEKDALRVVDSDGARAFSLFRFNELDPPQTYEGPGGETA